MRIEIKGVYLRVSKKFTRGYLHINVYYMIFKRLIFKALASIMSIKKHINNHYVNIAMGMCGGRNLGEING